MGDQDAALSQDQLNIAEAEAEHMIQPHGVTDDLGREAMAMIRTGLGRDPVSFAGPPSRRQLRLTWQCPTGTWLKHHPGVDDLPARADEPTGRSPRPSS